MDSTATYIDMLLARLDAGGDAVVLEHGDATTTAAELRAAVSRYARALEGLGIGPGSLVELFAPNRPDALAVRYAAHLLGAAAAYLPWLPDADERAALVAGLAPDLLVVFPQSAHLVPDAAVLEASGVPVAAVGCDVPGARVRLDELAAAESSAPLASRARPGELAVLISSGGSTGVPKMSVRSFAAYGAMVIAPPDPARRQLANGPLAHLTQALVDTTLLVGGTVVLQDDVEPSATLAAIESARVTDLFLVEPQLWDLMDHPDVAERDLSSLRALVHIGAAAPATLRLRARTRLGPVVAHTYGASETGIVSAEAPGEHDRPVRFTEAGRVRPGVEVRFRRGDGTLAAPGEAGVLEMRSPAMAGGYRHRPAEEAAAFVDGWYRTGDVARFDEGGYLHFLGRAGDLDAVDGTAATPMEVADTLCRVAGVRWAVVVPDRTAGTWVAAVVAWPGAAVDEEACRDAVAAERPAVADRLVVVPVDRVPLTEQGKPDRTAVRALAGALRAP